MKKRILKLFKEIIIVWTVIFTLLPTVLMGFSGYVLAANIDEGNLNTERAGNFAANFAINFYENWSSVNKDPYAKSGIMASGEVLVNADSIWQRVKSNNPSYGYTNPSPEVIVDDVDVKINSIDCSGFVACVIYATTGDDKFKSSFNCGALYGEFIDNNLREKYEGMGWEIKTNKECIQSGDTELLPGDIIISRTDQHCDIYIGPHSENWSEDGYVHYNAYDCGAQDNWSGDVAAGREFASIKHVWKHSDQSYESMRIRIPGQGSGSTGSTGNSSTYGVVKTGYDENKNVYELVNENDSVYTFNNTSWINFVYYYSLFKPDIEAGVKEKIFTGAGAGIRVNASENDDNASFNSKNAIPLVQDMAKDSPILDISELMSEGKILPGDILYVNKGKKDPSSSAEYEYLLYVGGSKIIYATNDESVNPSGALKYEYLEYYMRRIRKNLREGHEDDENYEMPKYGVTEIYRLKDKVAGAIKESDANLIFKGKGYYSKVKYEGIPGDVKFFETSVGLFKWLFGLLKQILELLFNIMIYAIRMQIIGWANLFENLLQHVLLGITGDNSSTGSDGIFGTSATSESGQRITVESIFFNQVPILDANFFNFESAGGHSLVIETEIVGPLQPGQERIVTVPDTDNVAYRLRKNLATIYIVFRNMAIAIMLFVLIGVGIKIALTSIAEKKAEFKQFLTTWLFAFCVILFMHFFMYAMFSVNDTFVGICKEWNKQSAREAVSEVLVSAKSDDEITLYDAVRTKAYAFNWKEGVPATVVYIYLVYLLIRFSFIYFKRYLTIYILALTAPFIGVKYAIDKLFGKKAKANSLNKWFKDFAFNVLLQTVHVFIYTIFMAVAISVSSKSVAGAFVAVIILNFMLKADSIIVKVFGLDKAGSLAEVNKPEKFGDVFRKFLPIYTISRGAVGLGKRTFFGDNGFIRRGLDNIFVADAKSKKDANKYWEMKKYNAIGKAATILDYPFKGLRHVPGVKGVFQSLDSHLPIRHLRMLKEDLSYDTKKKYYKDIKGYVGQTTGRFTRKIGLAKDLTLGAVGTVASVGVAIADPVAGAALLAGSRKMINKHKSMNKMQMKRHRYSGTSESARAIRDEAKAVYNETLKTHVDNEMKYKNDYNKLLDDYANAITATEQNKVMKEIAKLRKERRIQQSVEMHKLQEATENLDEAKHGYGNAKHEAIHNSFARADRRLKTGERAIELGEKLTGISSMENILMSDSRESYDAWDKAKKSGKKLDAMQKAAEQEIELRKLTKQFKEAIKNTEVDGKKLSDQEVNKTFEEYMTKMVKAAKSNSVKSGEITNAINDYLFENRKEKITAGDIDLVLNKVQANIEKGHGKYRITDTERQKIKQALENKMISDNKGLGLEDKDAAEIVRKVLGSETVLQESKRVDRANNDSDISKIQNKLFSKLVDIHTSNQVGKIKHKSEMINLNKAVKDAKKTGK